MSDIETTDLLVKSFRALVHDAGDLVAPLSEEVHRRCGRCWNQFLDAGYNSVGLPASAGGDGDLFDAMLLCVELGAGLCRAPLPDAIAGGRFLASLAPDLITDFTSGGTVVEPEANRADGDGDDVHGGWFGEHHRIPLRPIFSGSSVTAVRAGRCDVSGISRPFRAALFTHSWCDAAQYPLAHPCDRQRWSTSTALHHAELAVLRAAASYGAAAMMLSTTCEYLADRHQFGASLSSKQVVQHRMADCSIQLLASRELLVDSVGAIHAGGSDDGQAWLRDLRASIAFIASACETTAATCLHFFGGYGFSAEGIPSVTLPYVKASTVAIQECSRDLRAHSQGGQ